MIKQINISLIIGLSLISSIAITQPLPSDVKNRFNSAGSDSAKGRVLISYFDLKSDGHTYLDSLYVLNDYFISRKDNVAVDYTQLALCRIIARRGEYPEAISILFEALDRFTKRKDDYGIMIANRHLTYAYYSAEDKEKSLFYGKRTVELSEKINNKYDIATAYVNYGADQNEFGNADSGFIYCQKAVQIAKEINSPPSFLGKTLNALAECYIHRKDYDMALRYLRESLPLALASNKTEASYALNDLSQIHQALGQSDSAIFYAKRAIDVSREIQFMYGLVRGLQYVSLSFDQAGRLDSAYKYLRLTVQAKDSVYNADKATQLESIRVRERDKQRELEQARAEFKNKVRTYGLIAGLAIVLIIGLILFRNNRQKNKANITLGLQKQMLESTLTELRATQTQLIQSEKMASLGELTAGIAHEIQNPLNFVNNFSEVTNELVDEMYLELIEGNITEARALSVDIKDNLDKITHHGKRAEGIVKGMLQHSRNSSGQKNPTDINALCEEYLRLSYHGFQAKGSSYPIYLNSSFDPAAGKVNIDPQNVGKVIMNLLNNAFYAVTEKSEIPGFDPTVSISTKKLADKVEIRITDNGYGISYDIIDKIFQPFFTTKPAGQGTGLGLSQAYDIITKGHGGTLEAKTDKGKGSTFIIQLPII
ncbi:MAG: tetratricopeptide repeat protein [Chitinophagaceae bacterium]